MHSMRHSFFILCFTLSFLCANMLSGCGEVFTESHEIHAITREEGSGTRTAFCAPLGLTEEGIDRISPDIAVSNSTAVVISAVSHDCHAIGFISLGSMNDSVRALRIDGISPTPETIADGSYPLIRPFVIVYHRSNTAARALAEFILSEEGRNLITQNGYAPPDTTAASFGGAAGNLTVSGSSSVYPLMEQIREEFIPLRPG